MNFKTNSQILRAFFTMAGFLTTFTFAGTSLAFYTDVQPSYPFYQAIKALSDAQIIKGYADNTFHPDQPVQRDAFLAMIFRHIGYQPTPGTAPTSFVDVPAQSWFAPYVKKALDLGILSTNSATPHFFPEQPIAKVEALKMMMPLEGIPAPYLNDQSELPFQDVRPDASYAYLVRAAANSGLFLANDNDNFYPFKNLTRGELAQLLYQAEIYRGNQGVSLANASSNDIPNLTAEEKSLINNPKFPLLMDVWNEVNQEYYNQPDVNQDEMVYGAANGMVQTLHDPYSTFLDPKDAAKLESELQGQFDGIGVVIDTVNGQPAINEVLPNSPAEKAGLKIGDLFMSIDGKDVSKLSLEDLMNVIQGPADSQVALQIKRGQQVLTFQVTRAPLKIDSVQDPAPNPTAQVPSDLGYIQIFQFTNTTDKEFTEQLNLVLAKKPKGLILDLRNNGGGYLDTALNVLGHFVPAGQTVVNFKIDGKIVEKKSDGPGDIHIPVVVLMNGYTASASELVAGALQDLKVAKLIGEKSYGKGVAQKIINYTDGSILKLTFENWLTPLMHDINKVGLTPDTQVSQSKDDVKNGNDPQLQKAIEELE